MTASGDRSFKAVRSGNMPLGRSSGDRSGETEGGSGVCAILQKGKPCVRVSESDAVWSGWCSWCLRSGDTDNEVHMSDEESGIHSLGSEKPLNLQARRGHV